MCSLYYVNLYSIQRSFQKYFADSKFERCLWFTLYTTASCTQQALHLNAQILLIVLN